MLDKKEEDRSREKELDEEYGKGPDPWGFNSERVARRELASRRKPRRQRPES